MRPTPPTLLASLALFVALGGGAYAASEIGTDQIADRAVTAAKLGPGAVTTKKLARDAVTGRKADESSFGTVPSAGTAESLAGRSEFFLQLVPGQEEVVAQNGSLTLRAQCLENIGAGNDVVRIVAETTQPGAALEGADNLNSPDTGFLEPTTPAEDRELVRNQAPTGVPSVDNDGNDGFVAAAGGEALAINGESTVLGLNFGGGECRLIGVVEALGP